MLTPDAFKKCLISSVNTKQFSDYFLLLEKMIKYYNQYQLILNKLERTKLSKQLDELLIESKETNKELKNSNKKLDKLTEELNELKEENKQLQVTLNKNLEKTEEIAEHLHIVSHNQVPELNDDKMTHVYILLKKNDKKNEYYSLRTQQSKVKSVLNKKTDYNVILRFDNCPNPIELGTLIKEELKDIVTYRNNIFRRRINITEIELINKINELYDRRIITVL